MPFKVMLAGKIKDINLLKFPLMVSPKYDGVRAYVLGGRVLSRSNKPIPNEWAQKRFRRMESLDGELIVGNPVAKDCYRVTESGMMTADFVPSTCRFFAFDKICVGRPPRPFLERISLVVAGWDRHTDVVVVPQIRVANMKELMYQEANFVAQGYEGVMLRSLDGLYKQGRSTFNEGYLLKLKRFEDSEAVILECYEQETNLNPRALNELGQNKRSSHKAGKRGNGLLGGFVVKDVSTGVEFNIGTMDGVTVLQRRELWENRSTLKGKLLKYRHQNYGVKDKPRIPVFIGFRDVRDM